MIKRNTFIQQKIRRTICVILKAGSFQVSFSPILKKAEPPGNL